MSGTDHVEGIWYGSAWYSCMGARTDGYEGVLEYHACCIPLSYEVGDATGGA
jgi:hypothetical protein